MLSWEVDSEVAFGKRCDASHQRCLLRKTMWATPNDVAFGKLRCRLSRRMDGQSLRHDFVVPRPAGPAPLLSASQTFSPLTGKSTLYTRGSDGSAAGGREKRGPRKACFVGRGKAKAQAVFSACRKHNNVTCALTKRVAADTNLPAASGRVKGKCSVCRGRQETSLL